MGHLTCGNKVIWRDLSVFIPTFGNVDGLRILLSSLASNNVLPAEIRLVCDGKAFFNDFYLAQIADLLKFYGVRFSIENNPGTGEKSASDRAIYGCQTRFCLILHDDVWCDASTIEAYKRAADMSDGSGFGAIVGSKVDVNNIRGYEDYSLEPRRLSNTGYEPTYFIYDCEEELVSVSNLDTGNLLLDSRALSAAGVSFSNFNDREETMSSGHEFLFPMVLKSKGFKILFAPFAFAFHLEKPWGCKHSELRARVALAKREATILGVGTDSIEKYKGAGK